VFRHHRAALVLAVCMGASGVFTAGAVASTKPGWECIPATAGKGVVSGGTGSTPSCATGTTAVLAPTYVSSGVGGKPTVEFAAVNVQVVSGSGATSGAVNGEGNLVLGYAENPSNQSRTGSNDLVVGANDGWTGYGEIVGGSGNRVGGAYATAFGFGNNASGAESFATGHANTASGAQASATGGEYNVASDKWSSVAGGCDNRAGIGVMPNGPCSTSAEAVLGGDGNHATGTESTASGGQSNSVTGSLATVSAGYSNAADGLGSSVSGGYGNTATANESSITGGGQNSTTGSVSSIAGGYHNTATVDEASVLGGCSNVAGAGSVSVDPGCTAFGDSFTTIVGGIGNQDSPLGSAILGGENNAVDSGQGGAIAGGSNLGLSTATHDVTAVGTQIFNP
jgi:hypothetical protein